jgi:uncharacterized protein YegP (UPF0339 family)
MNQLFLQLAQSVTGNVITIIGLNLAAAIIGSIVAWFYAKSVYTPVIKALEADRNKLNQEISKLKDVVSGLNTKSDELDKKIAGLEADLEKKAAELKELSAKHSSLGKYEIGASRGGGYYFNLKATNGQVILTSLMFPTMDECKKALETARMVSSDDTRFERKISTNDKPFFNLVSADGQVLGKSELYESDASMEKGIASVRKNGPTTNIVEE